MIKARGIHHLAFSTADMKGQLEFFSDVLGLPLVAIFPMHGVPGGIHAFLEGAEDCLISFVQLPAMGEIEIEFGKTHAGNGALPSAPGTLQHLALIVDDEPALLSLRDRIRSRGINVIGPIDHGMCLSMYFAGPEGLTLEVATSDEPIDPQRWLDAEAAAEVGITPEALEKLASPAPYEPPAEAVPQPDYDPTRPHMRYPEEVYSAILALPDEQVREALSFAEPPVGER